MFAYGVQEIPALYWRLFTELLSFGFFPPLYTFGVCSSYLSRKMRAGWPEGSQQGDCKGPGCPGDGTRAFPPSLTTAAGWCRGSTGRLEEFFRGS